MQAPSAARKLVAMQATAPTQEEQLEYAKSLRMLKAGWTLDQRKQYMQWFLKAANYRGGASFDKFIEFIRNDAVASMSEAEKSALHDLLAQKPVRKSALPRTWIASVNRLRQHFPLGRYWWLFLTSGYRTYRFLPVFWREFWPRPEAGTHLQFRIVPHIIHN